MIIFDWAAPFFSQLGALGSKGEPLWAWVKEWKSTDFDGEHLEKWQQDYSFWMYPAGWFLLRKNVIMMLGAIGTVDYAGCWMIWVFPEIGAPAVLIHFNRILHDINPPAIKGYPHWWNIICGKTTTITTGCSGWSLTSHHPCRRETVASPIWNAALHMNQLFLLYPGLTLQSWWWTSSQTEIQIIRNQFQISFQVIQ